MNVKKIAYSMAVGLGLVAGSFGMVNAAGSAATNNGNTIGAAGKFGGNTHVSDINIAGTNQEGGADTLLTGIKTLLNWLLGIIGLVAFAMLLFGGFQMVTAGGDEAGYKKGFTYVKNAGIGLAMIGLAWIIIQFIFWLIGFAAGSGA